MQAGLWPTIAAPVGVVTLLKVSSPPTTRLTPRSFGRNPRSVFTKSDNDNTVSVVFPLEGIVLEHGMPGVGYW